MNGRGGHPRPPTATKNEDKTKETEMKKLIIAAALVATAAIGNAAQMKWSSGTIYLPNDDKGTKPSSGNDGKAGTGAVSGQIYYITGNEYTTWLETLTAATTLEAQQTAMTSLRDGLVGGTIGTGAVENGSGKTGSKGTISITDPKTYTPPEGGTVDAYAAVIYTYTDANDKEWFIADVGKYTFKSDNAGEVADMSIKFGGAVNGTQTIAGWATSAVPEPTSGLLLLLGVAGLALRRRRA